MSLFKAIIDSDYMKVVRCINKGANINELMNPRTPLSMLDIAIQISKDDSSNKAAISIVNLLKAKGALTYDELLNQKPKNITGLPPRSVKGTTTINKTKGIASLPRRGGSRRKTRKHRR